MIKSVEFIKALKKNKINFYTGVPDSLFSSLCNTFETKERKNHIISTNEGSSLGLAIGYHLGTGKIPLVYLQNSGLGNLVNPLVSLADKKVFKIPIFFLVGWRAEILNKTKQIKDEPQHITQGLITPALLRLLNIKYKIINSKSDYKKIIKKLYVHSKKNKSFVALLIRKNTFEKVDNKNLNSNKNFLTREQALKIVYKNTPSKIIKVSTTGMLSRELFEINKKFKTIKNTFMCVGGMGHSISIASGLALAKKKNKILCLDGDGSALMHLGSLANSAKINNLIHIVFNNFAHDSVGGQTPPSENIHFSEVAKKMGYKYSHQVHNIKQIGNKIKLAIKSKRSTFIEIICKKGHRKNLSRPKNHALYYKNLFMDFLKKNNDK
jgi:phosphonopyruvate decarboxylase